MHASQETLNDLGYVKQALARDRRPPFPASIAVLWAAICAVGFGLNDFAPSAAGLYWAIASPAGFLLSCWLGYRASRAGGELDRREGIRWALHFGVLLLAFFVAVIGVALGVFAGSQMGAVALLLCGVVFLLAGVHLAPPLAWVGALNLAGVPILLLFDRWQWTVIGVLVALAFLAIAATGARHGKLDTDAAR